MKKEKFNEKLIFIIKDKNIYFELDISTASLESGKSLTNFLDDEKRKEIYKKKKNIN